ncbi:MAG: carboxypeptidase regulatory-like domain-containing protein [Thermoanaerobaculum sp.]|nr:carboxypeptidase regulatory-like domain-containing protein [Thermoanaerobaculum sp.]MDW7967179.1 carboxypeptidase regulatory-like domain-containing protein [Thermoanaerobaculum sp.]
MIKRLFVVLFVFFVPVLLFAQAQGHVKGVVTDVRGNPIAGAKIIITCPAVGTFRKEITTDAKGRYSLVIVDATKEYLFHVEAPGFQAIEQLNKPLIGGQTLELNFTLKKLEEAAAEAEEPGLRELREGRDLWEAGKKAEARAKFLEAVNKKPDLYLAWLAIGDADLAAGKAAEALTAAEKCLAVKANFAPCLALAANAALAKGDRTLYEQYMAAYKKANPTDPAVLFSEAAEHINKGEDDKAKPLLEQALAINPDYPPALYELAMIYVRTGDNAKAKELLTHLLNVAPDYKDAAMAKEMLKYL